MSTPTWVLEILAAVMIVVAEVSAGQLVVARAWIHRGGADAGIAVSHLLMGIAMAGILLPALKVLPNAAWEGVFAAVTAWFVWCLWRESRGRGAAGAARGHYAPHLAHGAALLYVFATLGPSTEGSGMSMSGMGAMSGMAASGGMPTLALIFALLLIASTVHGLDRSAGVDGYFQVVGRRYAAGGPAVAIAAAGPASSAVPVAERLLLSPAVVKGCQVLIGVTMAFILIVMI